ncbi:MAG: UvrD-helicase domain-containing protein [Lachnospiraceae bacterium]|nr:UvrD-helicase domain-containing protein [Lachnospiraceae bacterium]
MGKTATKEQQDIIINTEGYIRCGAVPGSGKTFCITHRIAYLITQLYVDPASIVALTFTNKAADSMTKRLKSMIGDEATCFTGTFHGYCNKILKEEIHRLSYPKTFVILDKKDQIDLIREVAEELGLSLKDFTAKDYMEQIAGYKCDGEYVGYMIGSDKSPLLQKIDEVVEVEEIVYYHYLLKQRDNYVLDFDDIINFAIYILVHYPDVLKTWQERCQYILCDEYQDVNDKQEKLLDLLSGKYHNLTVVGDDDQCIYGWRGSKVDYMVNFDKKYPNVKDFYLSENFRSTPQIVNVANSLIEANQNRLSKKMFTNNQSGNKPVYHNLKTEAEEATWIAETIQKGNMQGKKYSDHAVLVRASSQTRALEEAFIRKKVPYKILNGAQFYGSEEIKTVLSYLRMIYAMSDLDFGWTIQRPRRGFGKKSVQTLKSYADAHGITLFEAFGEQIDCGLIKKKSLIDYYNGIQKLHQTYGNHSAKELVHLVLDMGYREELEQDVDQNKIDNVTEFITTVAAMEEDNQDSISLEELLAHFALFSGQDDDTDKDVVKVMTIHTAKGLEFDTVFVNGMVEGQFPSKKLRNQDELEEERRLFYVAVTRAKKMLYISSYDVKAADYEVRKSGFLKDIDVSFLDCINGSVIDGEKYSSNMLPKKQFDVGDTVIHNILGEGTVVSIDEKAQVYEIDFKVLEGTRKIQFRAPIEKLKE